MLSSDLLHFYVASCKCNERNATKKNYKLPVQKQKVIRRNKGVVSTHEYKRKDPFLSYNCEYPDSLKTRGDGEEDANWEFESLEYY